MKEKVAIVIAALMIASMAFAISTTSVTATHEQTPTIDETTVKGNTSMILTITITNDGPDAINNVRITVPSGFENFAPTKKVPKDNEVKIGGDGIGTDNQVVIPAGTKIQLIGSPNVVVPENTIVIRLKDNAIYYGGATDNTYWAILRENAELIIRNDATVPVGADNVITILEKPVVLSVADNQVRLVGDTVVVLVTSAIMRLPENTWVEPPGPATATDFGAGDNLTCESEETVTLPLDNDNLKTTASTLIRKDNLYDDTLSAGIDVKLHTDNHEAYPVQPPAGVRNDLDVVLPAGTKITLAGDTEVTVFENTDVIRRVNENVELVDPAAAENQPNNWTQTWNSGQFHADWAGIDENQIASGGNLAFPFAVTTPSTDTYTIYVRTTDTAGNVTVEEVTVTVDATEPTVKVAVSPEWTKANTKVTITVTADEPLAKLDNVMAAENENTENVQVEMTPNADKTVWTGTYTTTDNENRDGPAKVWVIGTQLEDLYGNTCASNENATFYVDKLKPPTPDVMGSIYGWVDAKKYTNIGEWLIEGNSKDNYRASGIYPSASNQENMTVKIRLGTTVYAVTSGENGYFYKSITLTEGTQEVGIQYIDPAGNVGAENAENITYDATKPSVSITSPENGAIINDNTPTIKLTISDAVMGIENKDLYNENFGYSVRLCYDNGDLYGEDNLTPKTDPTEDPIKSFVFENDWPTELAENWYRIYVMAGDNLQQENVYFRFEVDVTAPIAPTVPVGSVLEHTTAVKPYVTREPSVSISGDGDPGDTVNVYLDDETTPTETAKVASARTWSAKISLTGGHVTKISVSETDVAGNESAKQVWGYAMADATAPAVTLADLPEATDKASVVLSGTVTKDSWEDWQDITLTVQLGTGQVTVPITSVSGNDGSYSYSLSLAEGSNTIVVQAIDEAGNASTVAHATVERTVTPWSIYAIVLVIVALILAAIAIFAGPKIWKR